MRITIISLILTVFCFDQRAAEAESPTESNASTLVTESASVAYPPMAAEETEGAFPLRVLVLAGIMIAIQVACAVKSAEFPFDWPMAFRVLGSLSFAVFALISTTLMFTDDWKGSVTKTEVFYLLLTPFVGFVSCYLIAHVLETFNEIKKNTDKLRKSD